MQRIGRYEVVGELGRGAMGIVYRAQDPAIGRTVAIKTIRLSDFSDPAENSRLRDRLFREAQSAGMLSHPGIVTIYDIAEEGGFAYIFMEFVDGPTLESVLHSATPLGPREILNILRQVAAALDYAHRKGIVHRDIKPANIMLHEDGTPKIADFGVAKMLAHNMTQVGAIMGTPNYMAPEQVQGKPVDGRADQFALAIIAYETITGEKPFAADSLPTLLFKLVAEDPPLPHRLNPSLPREIDPVILRAMSKTCEGRYSSCSEFIAALEVAFENKPDWAPLPPGTSQSIPTAASPTNAPQTGAHRAQPRVPPPAPPIQNTPVPGSMRQPIASPIPQPPPQAPPPVQTQFVPGPPPTRVKPVVEKKSRGSKTVVAALFSMIVIGGLIFGLLYLMQRKKAESVPPPAQEPPPITKVEPQKPSALGGGEPQKSQSPVSQPASTAPAALQPDRGPDLPAAAQRPAGDYVVRIKTEPAGAKVVFDNNQSCTSPCTYELAPGRHTLSAVLAGYSSGVRIFELPRDSSVDIELHKPGGTFMLSTNPPGATIFLDGQERSEKSPAVIKLAPGKYKLKVTKEGLLSKEAVVEIKDGASTEINISWE
jgi:serine/threonine protein kinase